MKLSHAWNRLGTHHLSGANNPQSFYGCGRRAIASQLRYEPLHPAHSCKCRRHVVDWRR